MKHLDSIAQAIHAEIEQMTIIDAHEHLYPESVRLGFDVDALTLFRHYCPGDLRAAGMKPERVEYVLSDEFPLMERWKEFKPYYEKISNSTYVRSAHIALQQFYGESSLTDNNIELVSERIKKANKPGLYEKVIKETCKIETCLNQGQDKNNIALFSYPEDPLLTPVSWIHVNPRSFNDLKIHNEVLGRDVVCIEDLLEAAHTHVQNIKKDGGVGIKFFVFPMSKPLMTEAKETFSRIEKDRDLCLPIENPITNIYYDAVLDEAQKQGLVVCVHTGYWGDFRELTPSNAIYMFDNYPDIMFDLYHVGYPYVREAIMLGKAKGNVWMNMCWTYIISPHFACDALTEMLEMIPWNKIIGFGGDYAIAEKIYGHLVIAREVIAKAFAKKVNDCSMTLEQAVSIAHNILYFNPKKLYGLK